MTFDSKLYELHCHEIMKKFELHFRLRCTYKLQAHPTIVLGRIEMRFSEVNLVGHCFSTLKNSEIGVLKTGSWRNQVAQF